MEYGELSGTPVGGTPVGVIFRDVLRCTGCIRVKYVLTLLSCKFHVRITYIDGLEYIGLI